jgi:small subunit ribosomal protein S2
MTKISLNDLIESGAHFGHLTNRWNPKMEPYIWGKHKRIHIIDLKETIKGIIRGSELLKAIAKRRELCVFVSTKKQLEIAIEEQARRCGMPYVSQRWIGGTLTNFDSVKKQVNKLLKFEKAQEEGTIQFANKKEKAQFQRELERLRGNFSGLKEMSRLPSVIIAVDQQRSKTVLDEALVANIPTICLIDTDGNPSDITIPIPLNDDAIKSVTLVLSILADSIIEGKSEIIVKPLKTTEEKIEKAARKIVRFDKVVADKEAKDKTTHRMRAPKDPEKINR